MSNGDFTPFKDIADAINLEETVEDVRDWNQDLWKGQLAFQQYVGDIVAGFDKLEEIVDSEVTKTVVDVFPGTWDNKARDLLANAFDWATPKLQHIADLNECLSAKGFDEPEEKVDCIIQNLQDIPKSDRKSIYLKVAAGLVKQLFFDKTGKWLSDEEAEEIVDNEVRIKRLLENAQKQGD
jgi:hypothetical protein